jgi:hypothetical protein
VVEAASRAELLNYRNVRFFRALALPFVLQAGLVELVA